MNDNIDKKKFLYNLSVAKEMVNNDNFKDIVDRLYSKKGINTDKKKINFEYNRIIYYFQKSNLDDKNKMVMFKSLNSFINSANIEESLLFIAEVELTLGMICMLYDQINVLYDDNKADIEKVVNQKKKVKE